MQSVKEGMSQAEVEKILGRPGAIRTKLDPEGISTTRTLEIWKYGCQDSGSFATLGQIYFDEKRSVQYIYGHRGAPISNKVMGEAKLRPLLQLIDTLPRCSGEEYSPLPVIRVVNSLHGLGKEKALAVIDEYLRLASHFHSDAREGLFLVLRVLFELPKDGAMPTMFIGQPDPEGPKEKKTLPRFPVVLVGDVPLFVVNGYRLAGRAQQVEAHVKHFRKNGKLRGNALQPSLEPWTLPQKIENWTGDEGTFMAVQQRVQKQILKFVQTVYRPASTEKKVMKKEDHAAQWAAFVKASSGLQLAWSSKTRNYTFKDGTQLKETKNKLYRRHIWKSPIPIVTLQRLDAGHVKVNLEWKGVRVSQTVKFFVVDKHGRYLLVFTPLGKDPANALKSSFYSTNLNGQKTFYKSFQMEVKEGAVVQVELTGPKAAKSPFIKP